MKLVTYLTPQGPAVGAVKDEGVIVLGPEFPSMKALIAAGGLARAKVIAAGTAPTHRLADLTLLPVVPDAAKIVCVGLNYRDHKAETTRDPNDKPMLFGRWADTLIGHEAPLLIPRISEMLDWEAELVVVIGKDTGRYVRAGDALQYVFGYSCMNEGSVRDWQRHSSRVTGGKNFVGTGPVGPWIVTADEIPDPQALDLELTVNGAVMQAANTSDMIWSVAETIEYITNWMPLGPGDMIATGTPAGVGSRRTPPVFLKEGDRVEVTISGIGTLANTVARERSDG